MISIKHSFLGATGQVWKLNVGLIAVLVGLVTVLATAAGFIADPRPTVLVGAFAVGWAGIVWLLVAIRCPKCRSRIIFTSARTRRAGEWLTDVLGQRTCPSCNFVPSERPLG
jgi:hypothetical protein